MVNQAQEKDARPITTVGTGSRKTKKEGGEKGRSPSGGAPEGDIKGKNIDTKEKTGRIIPTVRGKGRGKKGSIRIRQKGQGAVTRSVIIKGAKDEATR